MSAFTSASSTLANNQAETRQSTIHAELRNFQGFDDFVRSSVAMDAVAQVNRAIHDTPPKSTPATLPYPPADSSCMLRFRYGEELVPVNFPADYDLDNRWPCIPYFNEVLPNLVLNDKRKLVRIIRNRDQLGKLAEASESLVLIQAKALDNTAMELPIELKHLQPQVQTLYLEVPPTLRKVQGLTRHKNLRHILLAGGYPVDLESLASLPRLESLTLINCNLSGGLRFLTELVRLQRLRLVGCLNLETLKGAKGHPNLRHLSIERCKILRVHQLCELPVLASIHLNRCDKLGKLPDFSPDNPVRELVIRNCDKLLDTHFLANARKLRHLELSEMGGIHLTPALRLVGLTSLRLPCMGIVNETLERIGRLTGLDHLNLALNDQVTCLKPLKDLARLRRLNLDCCGRVVSLQPVISLKNLTDLSLAYCGNLESLPPLVREKPFQHLQLACLPPRLQKEDEIGLCSMESLGLRGWTELKSLDFLEGSKLLNFLDVRDCCQVRDPGFLREHRGRMLVFSTPGSPLHNAIDGSNPSITRGPLQIHLDSGPWYDLPRPGFWNDLTWRQDQMSTELRNILENSIESYIRPRIVEITRIQGWADSVAGKETWEGIGDAGPTGKTVAGDDGTAMEPPERPGIHRPVPVVEAEPAGHDPFPQGPGGANIDWKAIGDDTAGIDSARFPWGWNGPTGRTETAPGRETAKAPPTGKENPVPPTPGKADPPNRTGSIHSAKARKPNPRPTTKKAKGKTRRIAKKRRTKAPASKAAPVQKPCGTVAKAVIARGKVARGKSPAARPKGAAQTGRKTAVKARPSTPRARAKR